ncbi:hypothetical protein Sjap_005029 [Stephania japonica]|uniref:Uncharacterized protein n=1 Tax=Stephania japonica TaxID=461633 RepID=A0AAP0K382_9MAGN
MTRVGRTVVCTPESSRWCANRNFRRKEDRLGGIFDISQAQPPPSPLKRKMNKGSQEITEGKREGGARKVEEIEDGELK